MLKVVRKKATMDVTPEDRNQSEELLVRIAAGDQQAFAVFFTTYAPRVKGFLLSSGSAAMTPAHAEELVQEVMLKVWHKAHTFDGRKARVSTWVFTVARNCRIDYFYRKQSEQMPTVDADTVWNSLESHDSPLDELQLARDQQRVIGSLSRLPAEQREVIRKVYIESKSHADVASELDLPIGTVKSRIRLALGKLKILLEH